MDRLFNIGDTVFRNPKYGDLLFAGKSNVEFTVTGFLSNGFITIFPSPGAPDQNGFCPDFFYLSKQIEKRQLLPNLSEFSLEGLVELESAIEDEYIKRAQLREGLSECYLKLETT